MKATLLAFMLCVPSANATLSTPRPWQRAPTLPRVHAPTPAELVIGDDTAIELDGKPCKYEDVPAAAEVILLEVAADGRSVRKVHFRTTRPDK